MRIGELGEATATKVETIRYYEQTGLLPPPERTSANYRRYDADHLARLSFIRRSRDLGCSTCPTTAAGIAAPSTRSRPIISARSTARSQTFRRSAPSSAA
jgi:hypothetical protein